MQIINNIIIVLLPVLAFYAGKTFSDRYHRYILDELEYILRLQAAQKGTGYVAPPPRKQYVGQNFMDKLHQNGRAVQQINPNQ